MAYSTIVKTARDLVLALADNSGFGGANVLTIAYEPGDWTMSVPKEERVNLLDRGVLVSRVRKGADQAITGSMSTYFRDATDAAVATLFDILNDSGYVGSNWVSTLGSTAEVECFDHRATIEGSDHGDGADHTITVTDVSVDYSLSDGTPLSTSVNWQSHTDVRPALT